METMPGDKDDAEVLERIRRNLYARPDTVVMADGSTKRNANENDFGHAKESYQYGEYELLDVYLRFSSATSNSFFVIKTAYNFLRDEGVNDPCQYLTPKTVYAYITLWNTFIENETLEDSNTVLLFTLMSGDDDCQIIMSIVGERGPLGLKEIKSLLSEIKGLSMSISSGAL